MPQYNTITYLILLTFELKKEKIYIYTSYMPQYNTITYLSKRLTL